MTLTMARLLGDLWSTIRREGDLVWRVVAPFVFLPMWAIQLLTDPPPALPASRDEAAIGSFVEQVTAWGQSNALWYLAADAIAIYGLAAAALLILAPERPDVGTALRLAATRYWRFVALTLLVAIPVGLGMWLFILPGLYAQARLLLALPIFAARPARGTRDAFVRSLRATRGVQFAVFAAVVALFLTQWLVATPFLSLDQLLRSPGRLNPFVLALADAAVAALSTAYRVALLLMGAALYRRLANRGT